MPILIETARHLNTAKQNALSSVRLQPSSFSRPGSYSKNLATTRERRVTVSFGTANQAVPVWHGLGFAPTGYTVLSQAVASGGAYSAPGKVYNDIPLPATSRVIVLRCDTANTIADILVR